MRFRLLGSLEVEGSGGPVEVPGHRLRVALAYLLVHRNEVVARDRLIDAVWAGSPPSGASHGLDVLVSRLRRCLGSACDGDRLETRSGGYRLRLDGDELDVDRFERSLAAGRRALSAGDDAHAIDLLRLALGEWRGTAFGDLVYEPFAEQEAARLEELRLEALEALCEAELRSGTQPDVISQLEALVTAEPLREHARALLMRALYASGRQAEALETYRQGRLLLVDQGLEPGGELRTLQAAILRHDSALGDHGLGRSADVAPPTRYVRNDGAAIAYQISGGGPYDVLYAPPFVTNVELVWQIPAWAALLDRLGSFGRLLRLDRRGTGMSDRVPVGDLDVVVDDFRAVMDAALSPEAAVVGASEAGPLGLLFAAAHPERVWALVLWGATARVAWAPDYPIGVPQRELEQELGDEERIWTEPGYAEALARALGAPDVDELASMWRQSASPGAIRALERQNADVDVRSVLAEIRVPTLVLNREGDGSAAAGSRYLAEHIPGARHVVFPGADHVMFAAGDFEPIVAEIQAFLDEAWAVHVRAAAKPLTAATSA